MSHLLFSQKVRLQEGAVRVSGFLSFKEIALSPDQGELTVQPPVYSFNQKINIS